MHPKHHHNRHSNIAGVPSHILSKLLLTHWPKCRPQLAQPYLNHFWPRKATHHYWSRLKPKLDQLVVLPIYNTDYLAFQSKATGDRKLLHFLIAQVISQDHQANDTKRDDRLVFSVYMGGV